MRSVIVSFVAAMLVASSARAGTMELGSGLFSQAETRNVWQIDWLVQPVAPTAPMRVPGALVIAIPESRQDPQALHRVAVEHSDAFLLRARIHKYASFATIPLFAAQLALGQSLYNNPGDNSKRGAHAAVGASIAGLFGVNTVTGVWNMFGSEGRQDQDGRTLRLVHGLLMMAADIGFVATSAITPESEGRSGSLSSNRSTHRNLAFASIGIGTAGYLTMLLGNH